MSSSKPFLLLLFPGPQYRLHDVFGERLLGLSRKFQGAMVIVGPEQGSHQIGNFNVLTIARRRSWIATVSSYIATMLRVVREQSGRGGVQLIVTYDPLRSGLIGLLARRSGGGKLLCEVNGDYANPANYMEVSNRLLRTMKRRAYVFVERFVLSRADGIRLLYPNQLAGLGLATSRGIVRSFPQFVKTSRFRPIADERVVLTVGFPAFVKGVDVLIDAFKKVSDDFPDWRLKILGHYPDRRPIDLLIGDAPRIELHPPVPRAEMPDHMGRCGIFVLASRTEGMGRVLVEAMAAGKARIGTKVGGVPTVIDDGEDGLLVPPEDSEALASALRRMMSDAELRARFARRSLARAQDEFSEERYFERTMALYSEVIEARARSDG